ncbi:MAG: methyltransferase, partial [SAR324 cluster bacterium]|nr:methyltransferase [SAR324 cluster bacterium]
ALAMLAGMQLELFTPLRNGPMSAGEMAAALDLDQVKLPPLLYALVSAELLTVENGRFANTAEADHFLVKGQPAYMGGMHELFSIVWGAMWHTAETIRSGKPQAKEDFAAMSEDDLRSFMRGLHPRALAQGRGLGNFFDLTKFRNLIDVAGGSGGLAIGACEAYAGLRGTVVDLPNTVPIARGFVEEAGMADRIDVQACDLTSGPPQGSYDLAVLSSILQVLSAEQCRAVLKHVGQVLEPGGAIHILGFVLDDSRLAPPQSLGQNMYFINAYDDGQSYTEQEHKDWLAEAGFVGFAREIMPDGRSAVTARKA